MNGINMNKGETHFKNGGGQGGGCQFIITFYFVVISTDAMVALRSASITAHS
jgi:hypothetical protein